MKRWLFLLLISFCLFQREMAMAQPPRQGYSIAKGGTLYWPRLRIGVPYDSIKELQRSSVKGLQLLLNARGANVVADGHFGSSTERAVKLFQKSRGLRVDGMVGYQTWGKLVEPLQRGSRGPLVRVFQILLAPAGYPIKVNGVFEAATEKAVRGYQNEDETGEGVRDGRGSMAMWCYLLGGYDISDDEEYGV